MKQKFLFALSLSVFFCCADVALPQGGSLEQDFRSALETEDARGLSRLVVSPVYFLSREERARVEFLLLTALRELPPSDFISRRDVARALFVLFPGEGRFLQIASREGVDFDRLGETYQTSGTDLLIAARAEDEPLLVINYILETGTLEELSIQEISTIEAHILDFVRPLPSSLTMVNRDVYEALSIISPENENYLERRDRYQLLSSERAAWVRTNTRRDVDEFTRAERIIHPDQPYYSDSRSYVSVSLVRRGDRVQAVFAAHYTANSWLFVEGAELMIDGSDHLLGLDSWQRENDAEVWEWATSYVDDNLRRTLIDLVASERATIRFRGQHGNVDVRILAEDRQIIHDMLLLMDEGLD